MTSQNESRLAIQAQLVLNNKAYQETYKRLTERYSKAWMEAGTVEEREALHKKVEVLQDVLDEFNELITFFATGDDAENPDDYMADDDNVGGDE